MIQQNDRYRIRKLLSIGHTIHSVPNRPYVDILKRQIFETRMAKHQQRQNEFWNERMYLRAEQEEFLSRFGRESQVISHYVTGQIENDETKRNEEILLRFREEAVNYKRNRFRMHNQSAPLAHHQMLPGLINPERFSQIQQPAQMQESILDNYYGSKSVKYAAMQDEQPNNSIYGSLRLKSSKQKYKHHQTGRKCKTVQKECSQQLQSIGKLLDDIALKIKKNSTRLSKSILQSQLSLPPRRKQTENSRLTEQILTKQKIRQGLRLLKSRKTNH